MPNGMTKSDEIWHDNTRGGSNVFLEYQPHLHPYGAGPQRPPEFLGPPACAHMLWETTTKFCAVIKLYVRKIVTRSTANADARSVCDS